MANFGERVFLAVENRILKPPYDLYVGLIEKLIEAILRRESVQSIMRNEKLHKLLKSEWFWLCLTASLATVFCFSVSASASVWFGWSSMAFGLAYMGHVIERGRKAKWRRKEPRLNRNEQAVSEHRFSVSVLTGAILVGVIGIEVAVRKVGAQWGTPSLTYTHLTFVACMVTAFLLVRLQYTGLKNPTAHRLLVYPFTFFYVLSFITGTLLIHQKFPILW